jgi:hypothetical protein
MLGQESKLSNTNVWSDPVWRAQKSREMMDTIYLAPSNPQLTVVDYLMLYAHRKPHENQIS